MVIASTIVMAAVAFFIVALPILRRAPVQLDSGAESASLSELLNRRDAVFVALRDLNFDHQVGKVSDEDHAVFEASLKESAAESLRAIDEWEAEADRLLAAELVASQRDAATVRATGARKCPKCAHPAASEDQFCASCGARLQEALPPGGGRCPQCGLAFAPGDQFCAGCGGRLSRR